MPSHLHDLDAEIRPLPQFGFGEAIDFDTLIQSNHFIFRVYSPKERSPFSDPSDPFFVAPKFDEQFTRSPADLVDATIKFPELTAGSYSEVGRHMEWTTRSTSPYISTSFSFSWSIWEAVRRYHFGVKKDVQIAIIDASALKGRAATAVQLLQNSSPNQRDQQFWKWHRFSHDSQAVLVYGMIPGPTVLASIPILQILRKMPSYFLRKDVQILDGNPLDQAAWDYTKHKSSYRHFCQHVSKLFLSRPVEVRLRDCTAGAVRLALSFLRPFFHRVIQEDFDIAISYLRSFALAISQWPDQSWTNDHPEVRQVVKSMVLALGEELREKYLHQQQEEISRLQIIIEGLEYEAKERAQESQAVLGNVKVDSDGDFEIEYEESDEPTLVTMDVPIVRKRPSLELSIAVLPRIPVSYQTPITPPDSPSHSFFIPTVVVPINNAITPTLIPKFVFRSQADQDRDGDMSSSTSSEPSERSSASPPTFPIRSPVFSPPSAKSEVSSTISSRRSSAASIDTLCETEFPSKRFSITSYNSDVFDPVPALPVEIPSRRESFSDLWPTAQGVSLPPPEMDPSIIPLPPSPSSLTPRDCKSSLSPSSPIAPRLPSTDRSSSAISPQAKISRIVPLPMSQDTEWDEDNSQSTTVGGTASYLVTGFLVGAFITLFLFSTQRRTLLYLT